MLHERSRLAYSSAGAAGVLSHSGPVPVEQEDGVEAEITYLVSKDERPEITVVPNGKTERRANYGPYRIKVRDARPRASSFTLDREGFAFVRHETAVRDFEDEVQVRETYYPEMEELVKQATGAEKVLVFDHNLRIDGGFDGDGPGRSAPVRRAHNDYTANSAPRRVSDLLDPEEAGQRLKQRVAVVNVWRPIRGPVETAPLALADAASVPPEDLVPADLIYPDRRGEIYEVAYNPEHRWYYLPRMARDEAILIKGYDSREDGTARFAPHTAFDDPATAPDAPPRESIEVRTLVFYPPEA